MGRNTFRIKQILRMASYYYPNWDKDYAQKLVESVRLRRQKANLQALERHAQHW